MTGTIRTYDAGVRAAVHHDIRQIAANIAASANAKAEVEIIELLDEKALVVGVRALAMVTANYLTAAKTD